MLRTRLWTAAAALPVTIAIVLFAGHRAFIVFIAVLGAWGLYEIVSMMQAGALEGLLVGVGGAGVAIVSLTGAGSGLSATAATMVAAVMLLLVARIGSQGAENFRLWPWSRGWLLFIGTVWVSVLFPYFALLRNSPGGIPTILLMLLLVVASDSGAYFAGRTLGRLKLLPRVSPNKTVEGALGGLAACIAAGLALRPWFVPAWSAAGMAIMAAITGVLAQFGDLAGSAFKRAAGVKDSGWIFPGHGGLLDRTCSLVFAAAFTYYYSRLAACSRFDLHL